MIIPRWAGSVIATLAAPYFSYPQSNVTDITYLVAVFNQPARTGILPYLVTDINCGRDPPGEIPHECDPVMRHQSLPETFLHTASEKEALWACTSHLVFLLTTVHFFIEIGK